MKLDVVYNKSCQRMDEVPDECVDLIPTDPPYGIGFMGKHWDKFNEIVNPQGAYEKKKGFKKLPRQSSAFILEYFTPIWRECFRVLKPGAFAFVMCVPRQDCLAKMIVSLEDAGFWIGFTPMFHAFASGFPKAQNIGKAVDKRLGAKRKVIGQKIRGDVEKAKRSGTTFAVADANKNNKDIFGYGIEDITFPATLQAQALDGSYGGFQPKPAVEVILVAMKPLSEKTYVDQALANRHGISWLDEGRIPYRSEKDKEQTAWGRGKDNYFAMGTSGFKRLPDRYISSQIGRFPANLLISDDALNDGKVSKSEGGKTLRTTYRNSTNLQDLPFQMQGYGDSGSFSRYFSLDAWFEKRLRELPKSVQKTFPFLIVPKASKAEKNRGCEELYWEKDGSTFGYHQIDRQRWEWLGREEERIYKETGKRVSLRARGNIHPTVKPLKLPCYLITIGSRPGDVIVDPFMGSGTMPIAAKILRRHYIAFETEAENVKIAKARLSAIEPRLI